MMLFYIPERETSKRNMNSVVHNIYFRCAGFGLGGHVLGGTYRYKRNPTTIRTCLRLLLARVSDCILVTLYNRRHS